MKVEDIMTVPVSVTQPDVKIGQLKSTMGRKKLRAVPVLSMEGEIKGVVSVVDLVDAHDDQFVSDVMTNRVVVSSIDGGLKDVARMMLKNNVHHIVAMDEGGVKGIVSSMDIVHAFANEFS